jgi:hypothetical protein
MGAFSFQSAWSKWLAGLIFWTLVGIFFSTHAYYYFSDLQHGYTFFDALKGTLPQWYIWGLLAALIIRLDRALGLDRVSILRRALTHLPTSIACTLFYVLVESLSDKIVYGQVPPLTLAHFAGEFQWNLPNYWFIVGAFVAYEYHREYRNREFKAIRLEAQLAKARLHSIKTQLRPHFLFNTLNTISAFMESDPKTARRMAAHLGDLLRFFLEESDQQEIPLAQEVALLERYLDIQRVRFEDRLKVEINIASETGQALVPALLTQPLVENSIKHGFGTRPSGGALQVNATKEGSDLHLQLLDDGVGLPHGWLETEDLGLGLSNTKELLWQLYNGGHRFEIKTRPQGGVCVDIFLPLKLSQDSGDPVNALASSESILSQA